ncbi:hypothetical protein Taro_016720 [Colocasia esculenta]|uniref:Triacylglycerol lipase n=1 Tax=Colocasia esculenta TaxID=4460 RepID=A0A843UR23_COLES|nr:hypothetical protein [Colocasia esculenta]
MHIHARGFLAATPSVVAFFQVAPLRYVATTAAATASATTSTLSSHALIFIPCNLPAPMAAVWGTQMKFHEECLSSGRPEGRKKVLHHFSRIAENATDEGDATAEAHPTRVTRLQPIATWFQVAISTSGVSRRRDLVASKVAGATKAAPPPLRRSCRGVAGAPPPLSELHLIAAAPPLKLIDLPGLDQRAIDDSVPLIVGRRVLPFLLCFLSLFLRSAAASDPPYGIRSVVDVEGGPASVVWVVQLSDFHFSVFHPERAVDFTRLVDLHCYWDWSWQDLAENDLRDMINYVYSITNSKVFFVGHSQGTIMGLATLTIPDIPEMIEAVALLCPISYLDHISAPLVLRVVKMHLDQMLLTMGIHQLNFRSDVGVQVLDSLCDGYMDCANFLSSITGTSVKYVLEQDRSAVIRLIGISVLQSAASSIVAPSLRVRVLSRQIMESR